MANIVHGPDFQHATTVVLSDTEDNAVGSCGVHNAGATEGLVNIMFDHDGPTATLRVNAGAHILCHVRRVLATGTTIAEADLRILF